MNFETIVNTYGIVIVGIILIKVIYFLVLISRVGSVADDSYKTQKKQEEIIELLEMQNEKLERIAQALEQEEEPYIIEKEDG